LLISVVIDSTRPARADTVSVEKKVTEIGTAMKGWAMAFGADIKKSGETTREAFLNDVERIKQSQFVQFQKKSFEQAKEQLARNRTQIAELFEKLGGFIGRVGKN
jgi:ATP phosphoribosyltransferase